MALLNLQQVKSLCIALLYASISLLITFINRAVFYTYKFNFPLLLSAAQMTFSIVFMLIFGGVFHMFALPELTVSSFKKQAVLSFCFLMNVPTGLWALTFLNIPMFSTLRKLTTPLVMIVDFFWRKIVLPKDETWSVLVTVLGAIVAGVGDLQFHALGYFLCLVNCIFTGAVMIASKLAKAETRLSEVSLLFFPNVVAVLPMLTFAWMFGEFDGLATWPTEYLTSFGFWFCFIASSMAAFALNFSTFLCSSYNSPLSTCITGQIKHIAQIGLGLVWFGDVVYDPLNLAGLLIAVIGSMWYTWVKYKQTATPKPAPPTPAS